MGSTTPYSKPWAAIAALCLGAFISTMDMTIINIALPHIAAGFHIRIEDTFWAVNIYILITSTCILLAGKIGGKLGFKCIYQMGTLLFLAGSVGCALSPFLMSLVIFRALQGLGAALLMPQILSIIKQTFPKSLHSWAFGLWSATSGIAAIVGPTVGGFIVDNYSWRMIFWLNLPVCIAIFCITHAFVSENRSAQSQQFDIPGLLLSFFLLLNISYLLMNWNENNITLNFLLFAVTIILTPLFIMQQRAQQKHAPLIPFKLIKTKYYFLMISLILFGAITIFTLVIVIAIYFQATHLYGPVSTGLLLAPASLFSTIGSFLFPKLSHKFRPSLLLNIGFFITFLCCLLMMIKAFHQPDFYVLVAIMSCLGVGNGLAVPAMNFMAMEHVPAEYTGSASGLLNMFRQVGMLLGSALISFLLSFGTTFLGVSSYLLCFAVPVFFSLLATLTLLYYRRFV